MAHLASTSRNSLLCQRCGVLCSNVPRHLVIRSVAPARAWSSASTSLSSPSPPLPRFSLPKAQAPSTRTLATLLFRRNPPSSLRPAPPMGHRTMIIQAQAPTLPPEDFEPVEEGDDTINLTGQAIQQITRAQAQASNPQLALRVAVESGGCHGYQYKMQVTDQVQEDDYLFQPPSSAARLVIDSASLPLISGSTIDYATELIGSSFRVQGNPHASDKGGCGCGVSWELKEQ
ncbi:BQ5605_C035g11422 [Microbotryum silenes-dioicae]|uniref:BQ5605_C035g11422 protein n=1 Tax=Microbotryum silenes-dioicae TaxID=796604 RepID=A0A2X0PGS4_9BASI|nr:BQ5605_C035g11422 [Microbotryum silenes-dioicae]